MTIFGFIVGTTLINTLFLFDLHCTKYQNRFSKWGATMVNVQGCSMWLSMIPFYTLGGLWFNGLLIGNQVSNFQLIMSLVFWAWFAVLYIKSTYVYYDLKLNENEKSE